MIEFQITKYEIVKSVIAVKGNTFQEEINVKAPVLLIKDKLKWEIVQKHIAQMLNEPNRIFEPL